MVSRNTTKPRCPCGRPLHYASGLSEAILAGEPVSLCYTRDERRAMRK